MGCATLRCKCGSYSSSGSIPSLAAPLLLFRGIRAIAPSRSSSLKRQQISRHTNVNIMTQHSFLLLRWIHDRRLSYLDYAQQPICLLPPIVTFTSNKTPAKSQHDYQLQNSSALWKLKNIPRDFSMENFRPPATFDISAQTKCQTLFSKDKHTQLCCCKQPSEIKYTLLIQSRLAYCFWANRGVRTFSMCTPHTTSNFVFCGNENNFWVENSFMPLTSHISHRTSCVNLSGGILWIM